MTWSLPEVGGRWQCLGGTAPDSGYAEPIGGSSEQRHLRTAVIQGSGLSGQWRAVLGGCISWQWRFPVEADMGWGEGMAVGVWASSAEGRGVERHWGL